MVVTDGLSKGAVVASTEEKILVFDCKKKKNKNHKILELGIEIFRPISEPGKGLPTDEGRRYKQVTLYFLSPVLLHVMLANNNRAV